MKKTFYRSLGSNDELLAKLPDGHTMSMGYLSETMISESDVMFALMNASMAASSDRERQLIQDIANELGIH